MLGRIIGKIKRWRKDPFGIDRDWEEFKAKSNGALCVFFYRLMAEDPRGDKFRRLCHFIALKWVNEIR